MCQSRLYQEKGTVGADTRMGVCLTCSRQIKDKEVMNVHSQWKFLNIFKYLLKGLKTAIEMEIYSQLQQPIPPGCSL